MTDGDRGGLARPSYSPADPFGGLRWPRRTERLELRPVTVEDAVAAHCYRSDPMVTRYLSHGPLTYEQVVVRHEDRVRRMTAGAPDPLLGLAVVEDGRLVGDCMLRIEKDEGSWVGWIGYALSPEVHGRGLATEVARELVEVAREIGLPRVLANVRLENSASLRVLAKCGMEPLANRGSSLTCVLDIER